MKYDPKVFNWAIDPHLLGHKGNISYEIPLLANDITIPGSLLNERLNLHVSYVITGLGNLRIDKIYE